MTDDAPEVAGDARVTDAVRGAVIVGVTPGEPPRVLREAARYSNVLGAPLLVVHVDVTRFVTYEDPDGYVHSAPIDMNIGGGEADLTIVKSETTAALEGREVSWSARQLVG